MNLDQLLLIAAAVCFVFEAFHVTLGALTPKWWALGVAFYIVTSL